MGGHQGSLPDNWKICKALDLRGGASWKEQGSGRASGLREEQYRVTEVPGSRLQVER